MVCTKERNPSIKKLDTSSVALKRTGPIQTAAAKTHLSQNLCQNFDYFLPRTSPEIFLDLKTAGTERERERERVREIERQRESERRLKCVCEHLPLCVHVGRMCVSVCVCVSVRV